MHSLEYSSGFGVHILHNDPPSCATAVFSVNTASAETRPRQLSFKFRHLISGLLILVSGLLPTTKYLLVIGDIHVIGKSQSLSGNEAL